MPLYEYTARDSGGGLQRSRMEGASPKAIAAKLDESGMTPISIEAIALPDEVVKGDIRLPRRKKAVSIDDLIGFSRQMATLTMAGLPLVSAIKGLADGARNREFGRALENVAEALQSGRNLSSALGQHPKIFSTLFMSVVHVGENTGQLDEAFQEISRYLEQERDTSRRIKSATRYPMMVIIAITAAMFLLNLFVLPSFAQTFESMGKELPFMTQLLVASSQFTVANWPHILVGTAAIIVGVKTYIKTPHGKWLWDRYKLMLPIMGNIIKRSTLARYARTFAMTSKSGLGLNQTMEIVARAVDNDFVARRVTEMRQTIEHGEGVTRAAAASGLFTPLVLQMMGVGEQTGTLAEMHLNIAIAYESDVDYDLQRMNDLIEPLLIICIGGMVLVLALGIYLPMWDFGS